MENKQTAVEFLVDKLNNYFGNNDFIITYQNEISKALELEKQQIINAHLTGNIFTLEMKATKQATEYYFETYKKPTE